jgi:hypothetical protein
VKRSIALLIMAVSLAGLQPNSPGFVAKAVEKGCCEGTQDSGVTCDFPNTFCTCRNTGAGIIWSGLSPQECIGQQGSGTCDCVEKVCYQVSYCQEGMRYYHSQCWDFLGQLPDCAECGNCDDTCSDYYTARMEDVMTEDCTCG